MEKQLCRILGPNFNIPGNTPAEYALTSSAVATSKCRRAIVWPAI